MAYQLAECLSCSNSDSNATVTFGATSSQGCHQLFTRQTRMTSKRKLTYTMHLKSLTKIITPHHRQVVQNGRKISRATGYGNSESLPCSARQRFELGRNPDVQWRAMVEDSIQSAAHVPEAEECRTLRTGFRRDR